jgi:hypothetical protein
MAFLPPSEELVLEEADSVELVVAPGRQRYCREHSSAPCSPCLKFGLLRRSCHGLGLPVQACRIIDLVLQAVQSNLSSCSCEARKQQNVAEEHHQNAV